jgi:hypothetical protein
LLRTPPTSSSRKNVLNVPQTSASSVESRARLRSFLRCILVGGDSPAYELLRRGELLLAHRVRWRGDSCASQSSRLIKDSVKGPGDVSIFEISIVKLAT